MSLPRALLLAAALLSVDAIASPIQTNYGTGDGSIPGGGIPASNLLSTNLLSATRTGSGDAYFYQEDSGNTVNLARLYDGQFGSPGGNQAYTVMPNVVSLTFNLNLAARPAGYDIASIRTYAGWDSDRDGQAYTVEYSTAANPGQFAQLATVNRFDNSNFPQQPDPMYMMNQYMSSYYMSMANQSLSMANSQSMYMYDPMYMNDPMYMYNPMYDMHMQDYYMYLSMANMYQNSSMTIQDTSQSSTMVSLTAASGVLASGVAALRFNFAGVENGGTAYREIVVEGIAPTTLVGTVADLASFNVAGVVTFEGGRFSPTSSASMPAIQVAAGFAGTLDATAADIASGGAVTIAGTGLTLAGSTTSTISLSGDISGAGILVNASGNNVISGANTCAGIAVTGGSLRVNSATSLTSVINSVSGGGTMILPTDIAFNGTVTIAGSGAGGQPGALVLDATATSASGGSSLTVALTGDATIALRGGQDYALSGAIAGLTPGQNLTLNIDDHTLTLAGTTASSVAQMTKEGAGVLLLGATGVINSGSIVVSDGLLTNNGLINGAVSVAANGMFGGSGLINGTVTVSGTLAPGNSPGLQTQVAGDTTQATGSHFLAQLGGITPGNGDGFHDQYFVQAGSFIIDPGVTLDVRSWVEADGLTTFVPARRDIFAVIRAQAGISGQFSDLTNPDYSQWIIYENNTNPADQYGYLYGTGLSGNQTFAAYGDTTARAAIGASLWAAAVTASASSTSTNPGGFVDGSTVLGQAAIGLLTTPDTAAYLDALSPEAYLAVGDYALTTTRSLTDAAFAQSSLLRAGSWTLGAGYNRAGRTYTGAAAGLNHRLTSETPHVTAAFDFGPHCSIGFFYGQNHGRTVGNAAQLDYRGGVFGLTSVGRIPGAFPVTLKGAVVASDLRFDASRAGALAGAGSATNRQKLRSLGGQLTASVELYKDGRISFSPTLGFVHGRATTNAFTETGAGANLALDALAQESSRLVAGFAATYLASSVLVFDLTASFEHEYASAVGSATATFAGAASALPMTTVRGIDDRQTTTLGLGASWQLDPRTTLRVGAEVRGNRELSRDHRYNASVNVRF